MNQFELFTWWASENAIAHAPSAWQAWAHKDREVAILTARLMQLSDQNEHLQQQLFESEQRKLRLIHSAA